MPELWQLYDENGQPLADQGATKDDVFAKGLLHGAAHVWIWRRVSSHHDIEVLVQKRSTTKRTWPNLYDISAAGHIALGETPGFAACREAAEEVGVIVQESDLQLIGRYQERMNTGTDDIENEFQYLYLLEVPSDATFVLEDKLESVDWWSLETFIKNIAEHPNTLVPHGKSYFEMVIKALQGVATL